jgi:hypothetical protein
MEAHKHPRSGEVIYGVRLGPGAEILKTDRYDSSKGNWEEPPFLGYWGRKNETVLQIHFRCQTYWVRPDAEISAEALELLRYLVERKYSVLRSARWGTWRYIPSPGWRNDPRMDWPIENPDAARELARFGFISPTVYENVLEVSEIGLQKVTI